MKKLIVITTTVLLALTKVEAEETPLISTTISSSVASKYIFATGMVLSPDPVIQTDLFFNFKGGLYIDLWNSRSLRGKWDDGSLGNEIDYGIGWNGRVKDFTVDIGLTYFDEPTALTFSAGDIVYSHVKVGRDLGKVSCTLSYDNYTSLPGIGLHGGNLISLGVRKDLSFYSNSLTVTSSLIGAYDTSTLGSGAGVLLHGVFGLNWTPAKHITMNIVSVNCYVRHAIDAVVSTGFSFSF